VNISWQLKKKLDVDDLSELVRKAIQLARSGGRNKDYLLPITATFCQNLPGPFGKNLPGPFGEEYPGSFGSNIHLRSRARRARIWWGWCVNGGVYDLMV
jgi:hypothetical protein